MNHPTQTCPPEDTIDLKELFAILSKRKKMIIAATASITLLAVIYAYFIAKPVYEIKTMIDIGKIKGKPLDDINDVKQKLSYEYQVTGRGIKRTLPYVKSVNVAKGSQSILSLTIHSQDNTEGKAYARRVIDKIKKAYQEKINAYIVSRKAQIALTEKEIDSTAQQLKKMQKEPDGYDQRIITLKREDSALAGIYALQASQKQRILRDLMKYIADLKNKEQALKLSLSPLNIQPTHTVGEIETLDHPVKPKKILITVVAFISGLMLSVFLAFFLEFIQGLKKEE